MVAIDDQAGAQLAPGVRLIEDGGVAVVVVDRPEARNAVSAAVADGLDRAVDAISASGARVAVLTGGGDRAFISGGDLKELAALRTLDEARAMATRVRAVLDRVAALPIPVIAALNGDAYGGGGEVALAADIRVAAADVRVGFTQIQLGIMPAWGGIERLARLVGRGRAMYLLTSGTVLAGDDLRSWGLVEEVVPRADFAARWRELAAQLAAAPSAALAGIKAVTDAAVPWTNPASADLAVDAFAATWVAPEHWEAAARHDAARRQARRPGP